MNSTTRVSEKYKNAQKKSILWIILFIITFILSLLVSVTIFIGSIYFAYSILSETFKTGILLLLVGLCTMTGMIMFFNFKYLFSIFKKTQEEGKEIFSSEYPELFQLINETANEIGTKQPKKVFLIQDINASVYYSNHIQSLFFPTSKNLNIGVGLLQMTSINELKGILAHEFGHFSQKSMTIGSYSANAFYVINEIVNNKDSITDIVNGLISIHPFVGYISYGSIFYNKLFEKIYLNIFNQLSYQHLALSREMEYHADQIATSVVGVDVMIKPMLRMNLYISLQEKVTDFYYRKMDEELYSLNYYQNLNQVVKWFAKNNNLKYQNGLVQPELDELSKNYSKLHLENIYSTHPDLKDSIENIVKTNIQSQTDNSLIAKTLIKDIEKYEEDFTFDYFFNLGIVRKNILSDEAFIELFEIENINNNFPKEYHGLYAETTVNYADILAIDKNSIIHKANQKEIFSQETTDLFGNLNGYENDLILLDIINENKQIKAFKYDNINYKKSDINQIKEQIIENLKQLNHAVLDCNHKINLFFAANLTNESKNLAELSLKIKDYENQVNELVDDINENGQFMFKQNHEKIIKDGIQFLHQKNEEIKKIMLDFLSFKQLSSYYKAYKIENYNNYINDKQTFYNGDYLEHEISDFYESLNFLQEVIAIMNFEVKKDFLSSFYQAFEAN